MSDTDIARSEPANSFFRLRAPQSWGDALKQGNFASIADWFVTYFFGSGLIILLALGFGAFFDNKWSFGIAVRIFSVSLVIAGASTVCGWVLGLLFGIPRSLSRFQQSSVSYANGPNSPEVYQAASGAASVSRTNTNLEDISDWLTKTIVGVGLTQLFAAPEFLWHVAGKFNDGGLGWPTYGKVVALSLLMYFTLGGFWLGYVGTRTILTKLFDSMELDPHVTDAAADPKNLKLNLSETGVEPAADNVAAADRQLLQTPLQQLRTVEEVAAWAAAQARAGNVKFATGILEDLLSRNPGSQSIRDQLGILYWAIGKRTQALQLMKGSTDRRVELLNALYQPPPGGYQRAIEIGEKLIQEPETAKDASVHVWLACAYGQQYWDIKSKKADDPRLATIRDAVLAQMKTAIALDPSSRDLLRSLWQPKDDSEDNDLSGFDQDDKDFHALLD